MSEESQFNVQGYNIVTILKRLEAATSRLEDITIFQDELKGEKPIEPAESKKLIQGAAAPAAAAAPAPAKEVKSVFVDEFNELITSYIQPFVAQSKELDLVLGEAADEFAAAFDAQATFLTIVKDTKRPEYLSPEFLELLAPINQRIEKIGALKDAGRRSDFFNHLNTIAEGSPVLGWIVSDTPVSLIPEFKDSAQFWSNRVMSAWREKDERQVEWVKKFLAIFEALQAYVKKHHATGPSWNPKGAELKAGAAAAAATSSAPASGSGAGGPPPPPPPPPADLFDDKPSGGINAVFADLNKGEAITSGLKKVDRSQMTHKNPELRKSAVVESKKPAPPKKPSSLKSVVKKPASKRLVDGAKWIVENFTAADASEPIVIDAEMHQSIFIGHTEGVTIHVKGKANAISLSETKATSVIVDSLVSGFDVIKSVKFGIQILGVVPLISIDKSDEGTVYLSKDSLDIQVFSSSTTALNINVPTPDDDYEELAAPEQFKHTIKGGKLVSEVAEFAG